MAAIEATSVKAKIADIEALICRADALPKGTIGGDARAELDGLRGADT